MIHIGKQASHYDISKESTQSMQDSASNQLTNHTKKITAHCLWIATYWKIELDRIHRCMKRPCKVVFPKSFQDDLLQVLQLVCSFTTPASTCWRRWVDDRLWRQWCCSLQTAIHRSWIRHLKQLHGIVMGVNKTCNSS